ncbi:MAG: ATP-binding protein [Planctomycetota bacterium]
MHDPEAKAKQPQEATGAALSLHLKAKAQRCNLPPIRQCLEGVLRGWRQPSLEEEEVGEILLALLEACSNVIAHAYQGREVDDIEIDTRLDPIGITITIKDRGVGFDLEAVPPPKFGRKPALGGYGLYMMRGLMDLVRVSRDGGETVLTITRRWRSSPTGTPGAEASR